MFQNVAWHLPLFGTLGSLISRKLGGTSLGARAPRKST